MIHWMAATRPYTPPPRARPPRRGREPSAGREHPPPRESAGAPRLLALLLLAALPARAEELIRVVVAEALTSVKLEGERLAIRPAGGGGAGGAAGTGRWRAPPSR